MMASRFLDNHLNHYVILWFVYYSYYIDLDYSKRQLPSYMWLFKLNKSSVFFFFVTLAIFQVLNKYIWPMATILENRQRTFLPLCCLLDSAGTDRLTWLGEVIPASTNIQETTGCVLTRPSFSFPSVPITLCSHHLLQLLPHFITVDNILKVFSTFYVSGTFHKQVKPFSIPGIPDSNTHALHFLNQIAGRDCS